MAHDINLTSQEWLNIIFEGKNKDYGAYRLRQDSSRRHLIAFISVAVLTVLAITVPGISKELGIGGRERNREVIQLIDANNMTKPEVPEEHIKKQYQAPPPVELKSTMKFTAPVIKKDELVKEENEVKSQDEITESKVAISVADVKGTNEDTGIDIAILNEHHVIVADTEPEKVFEYVEQPPSFPGGDAALMDYLNGNISYPTVAQELEIQGKVTCSFVVGKDGSIQDVKVERGVDRSIDKEAVRVISSMPRWIPGRQGGNAVKVKYYLPVVFRLQ